MFSSSNHHSDTASPGCPLFHVLVVSLAMVCLSIASAPLYHVGDDWRTGWNNFEGFLTRGGFKSGL